MALPTILISTFSLSVLLLSVGFLLRTNGPSKPPYLPEKIPYISNTIQYLTDLGGFMDHVTYVE